MTDVFVSYSRKDIAFARLIVEQLQSQGLELWIDWQDIPPSADWLAEIYAAIEASNTFVWVISHTSIESQVCNKEVVHALQNGKRVIPLVLENVDPKNVPPGVAAINWIFCREQAEFQNAFNALVSAVQTDLDWLKMHTRLQVRALEWQRKERDASFLLRGKDLQDAEQWLGENRPDRSPQPTQLQNQYLISSRKDAANRNRLTIALMALALVITLVLATTALVQRNTAIRSENLRATDQQAAILSASTAVAESQLRATAQVNAEQQRQQAETQRTISQAKQFAIQADYLRIETGSLMPGVLIAAESLQRSPNPKAEQVLMETLDQLPKSIATLELADPVQNVVFHPDGNILYVVTTKQELIAFDWKQGKRIFQTPFTQEVRQVVLSNDSQILSVFWGTQIAQMNSSSGEKLVDCAINPFSTGEQVNSTANWAAITAFANPGDLDLVPLPACEAVIHLSGASPITATAFSPDGLWAAVGRKDGSLTLYDLAKRLEIHPLNLKAGITGIVFSPDSAQIAAFNGMSDKNVLAIWQTASQKLLYQLTDPHLTIRKPVLFSPNGQQLFFGSNSYRISNGFAQGGTVTDGNEVNVSVLNIKNAGIRTVSMVWDNPVFNADSRLLAANDNHGWVYILDTLTLEVLLQFKSLGSDQIVWDTDKNNRWLATIPQVWKLTGNTPQLVAEFTKDQSAINNKQSLIAQWETGSTKVRVWPLYSDREIKITDDYFSFSGHGGRLDYSPNGKYLAVQDSERATNIYQVFAGAQPGKVKPLCKIEESALRFWQNDATLWVTSGTDPNNNTVERWDPLSCKIISSKVLPPGSDLLAVSPSGHQLTVSDSSGTVLILDTYSHKPDSRFVCPELTNISFSSNDQLFSCGQSVWDTTNGTALTLSTKIISSIGFSPDNRWIAYTLADGFLGLWDVQRAQLVNEIPIPTIEKLHGFSADSTSLVVSTARGIEVFSTPSLKLKRQILLDPISHSYLTPDGKYVIVTRGFTSVQAWDVQTGSLVLDKVSTISQFTDTIFMDAALSADGRQISLLLNSEQRGYTILQMELWQPADLLAQVCQRVVQNLSTIEWQAYIGSEAYHATCPNLPIPQQ
ncbi:MAG: TIR domain-containing protein [Chloroflexota bacterium]